MLNLRLFFPPKVKKLNNTKSDDREALAKELQAKKEQAEKNMQEILAKYLLILQIIGSSSRRFEGCDDVAKLLTTIMIVVANQEIQKIEQKIQKIEQKAKPICYFF